MLRYLLALLMILLAAPTCAGSRFGGGFHGAGLHRGGFPAFHHRGGRARGFFGGYICVYNCGLGFDGWGYDYGYGNGYGNGYGGGYGNGGGYANGYGWRQRLWQRLPQWLRQWTAREMPSA